MTNNDTNSTTAVAQPVEPTAVNNNQSNEPEQASATPSTTAAATTENNNNKRERESEPEQNQSKKRKTELLARLKQSVAKTDSVLTKQSKQPSTPTTPSTPAPATPVTPATSSSAQKTKRARKPNAKYNETPTSSSSDKKMMDRQSHRMCFKLLTTIKTHRWAWPFNQPVDPEKLGIPDYFTIIKNPMDLGSVEKKLINEEYTDIHQFATDVRLVWQNCLTYNQPGSDVVRMAEVLRDLFESKFVKIVERVDGTVPKPTGTATDTAAPVESTPNRTLQSKLSKLSNTSTPTATPPTATTAPAATKGRVGRRKSSTTPAAATEILPEMDSRPMTFEEMTNLSTQIEHLTSPDLAKVVDIIRSRAPKASSQASKSEIEIDLDQLDAVTLRMLEAFVNECMNVRRQRAEARSRAAERAAETRRLNKLKKEQEKQENTTTNNNNNNTDALNESTVQESGSDTAESGSDTDSDSSDSDTDSDSDNEKNIQPLSAQVQNEATSAANAASAGK